MNRTIEYYNENAQSYYELTVHADMSLLCDRFLRYVTPGGKIIDIGSGSGRDITYFLSKGYEAEGIDASFELCRISNEHGIKVENITIQDWNPREFYDGIWANASLVHVPLKEIELFFVKAKRFLKKEGVIFASMKVGLQTDYGEKGRFFCMFDESTMGVILKRHPELKLVDQWYSQDRLAREDIRWINFILK